MYTEIEVTRLKKITGSNTTSLIILKSINGALLAGVNPLIIIDKLQSLEYGANPPVKTTKE